MFLCLWCLQLNGPSWALVPSPLWGNLRCTARTVGSPAALSLWQWVRAVPKLLSFRDRSAVPSLHVPTFPWRSSHRRRWASTPGSAGAVTSHSHLWFHQELWLIQHPPGESEGTHRVLLSRSVPSVPRPHHGVTPAVAVAGFPPSCRLTVSPPPRPLAGSPLPWVTGLPRRCPAEIAESAVALLRRPWHKGSLMGPGRAGGPAAAERPCSDPREGKRGDPRGGNCISCLSFPPPAGWERPDFPVQGSSPCSPQSTPP